MACEHKWALNDEDFQQKIIARHMAGDTNGNCYVSKFMVYYWGEATFDCMDTEPVSEDEFNSFNDFLAVLNQRAGNIDTKKKLINYALDSMHWQHVPQFMLHNDDYNFFYFSVTGDSRDQKSEERFDWEFYDAVDMISEMRNRQRIMGAVYEAEKKCKEREETGDDSGEGDLEMRSKAIEGILKAYEK